MNKAILLRSLEIKTKEFGEDKGKIQARIDVGCFDRNVTITLSDEAAERIVQCAGEEIIRAVEDGAREFSNDLRKAFGVPRRIDPPTLPLNDH